MRIKNLELWGALLVIAVITAVYLGVVLVSEVPAASGFFGHSLGVVGFVLMLMTEILYSLRKRYMFARWGKLQHWLSFHIFTGLVGPYLVLLHSSWKFNGLAGILMLFTVIIVGSGFVGRYFYTAVPRSADGTILEVEQLNQLISHNQQQLEAWRGAHPKLIGKVDDLFGDMAGGRTNLADARRRWRELEKNAPAENRPLFKDLRTFWERQLVLKRQLDSLAGARRLLAIWHTVHIPLGVATFTIAFIHIGAALYYATFIH
jgi:hypothetical protein